jgi:hypothetical protein
MLAMLATLRVGDIILPDGGKKLSPPENFVEDFFLRKPMVCFVLLLLPPKDSTGDLSAVMNDEALDSKK